MLTRVALRNFRGFTELDAPIGVVTALLGPNSSGKTTALHAIRLACELFERAVRESPASLTPTGKIQLKELPIRPDALLPLADWEQLFPSGIVEQGLKLAVTLTFEATDPIHEIAIVLRWKTGDLVHLDAQATAPEIAALVADRSKTSPKINQLLTEGLSKHAPRAVFVPPFYGTVVDEEYRSRVVLDRIVGSGDQSHAVRNLIAALRTDDFERLNAFLSDCLGARIVKRTTGDELQTVSPLRVTFSDTNGELEISAAGAGLVNLIALFCSLARWRSESRPVLFLLDEPEAHLHPKLQADAALRTASLVTREYNKQLIIATHSVDILNRFSAEQGAVLLRCNRADTPAAVELRGDNALFQELGKWADLTPFSAINFLASRRIVFCEGKTDRALLPRLAALSFRNRPADLTKFDRWVWVELGSSGNQDVPKLLNKLLKSRALGPAAAGEPFHTVVVLDRDGFRAPGFSAELGAEPPTMVWSGYSIESLFLEPKVLEVWVRAFLEGDQKLLGVWIADAIAAADADPELRAKANSNAMTKALAAKQRTGALTEHEIAAAIAQGKLAEADANFQHGKLRAAYVLGHLRTALLDANVPNAGHFPTTVEKLVQNTKETALPMAERFVPREIETLFQHLLAT